MISQGFLVNFLVFWAVAYLAGLLLNRYLGGERAKMGVFYLEFSFKPESFRGIIGGLARFVGPLYKVGIGALLISSSLFLIFLVKITIDTLFGPKVAQIAPVIPGVTFDISAPLLISIFVILAVHEFGHAAASWYFGVPIRKIAFFVLFVLLGAFVEPDEEILKKLEPLKRMGVYSAGIFMNFATFFVALLLAMIIFPGFSIFPGMSHPSGVYVQEVIEDGPSHGILPDGVVIRQIGGYRVRDFSSLVKALEKLRPGQEVDVVTDRGTYRVRLGSRPDDPSSPFLGVMLSRVPYFDPIVPMPTGVAIQLIELLGFLIMFNLGLAGLNALPMLPLDGGLVLSEILTMYLGDEELARKLTWAMSAPIALMLIYNVLLFFLS